MDFLTLIKDGKHTAIVSYVKGCKCLSIDEELALISRGNHEEINLTKIKKRLFKRHKTKTIRKDRQ